MQSELAVSCQPKISEGSNMKNDNVGTSLELLIARFGERRGTKLYAIGTKAVAR